MARQVSHPNVCRAYDIGEAQGAVSLLGSLPHDKALEIAGKLRAAQDKGVIVVLAVIAFGFRQAVRGGGYFKS